MGEVLSLIHIYSSKTNTYYMNTYDDPAIRSYAMADYDMDSSELISVAR